MKSITKAQYFKYDDKRQEIEKYALELALELAKLNGYKKKDILLDDYGYSVHLPYNHDEWDAGINEVHVTLWVSTKENKVTCNKELPISFPVEYLWSKDWKKTMRDKEKADKAQRKLWDDERQEKWKQFLDLVDHFPHELIRVWKAKNAID